MSFYVRNWNWLRTCKQLSLRMDRRTPLHPEPNAFCSHEHHHDNTIMNGGIQSRQLKHHGLSHGRYEDKNHVDYSQKSSLLRNSTTTAASGEHQMMILSTLASIGLLSVGQCGKHLENRSWGKSEGDPKPKL